MIVETMSVTEMCKEFSRDIKSISDGIKNCFGDYNKFRRYLLKNHKKNGMTPIRLGTYWKEINGNSYLINIGSLGYKQFIEEGPKYNIILLYRKGSGTNCLVSATALGEDYSNATIFYSHFFDRYRERVLKNPTLSKKDTICEFFKKNSLYVLSDSDNTEKYKNSVTAYCKDGIILGTKEEDHIAMKTIISKELFKGDESIFKSQSMAWNLHTFVFDCLEKGSMVQREYFDSLTKDIKDEREKEIFEAIINDYFDKA